MDTSRVGRKVVHLKGSNLPLSLTRVLTGKAMVIDEFKLGSITPLASLKATLGPQGRHHALRNLMEPNAFTSSDEESALPSAMRREDALPMKFEAFAP